MSETRKIKRVSPQEVEEIYRLYAKYGSYAEVARITGRSASTIGRYISGRGIPKSLQHLMNEKLVK